MLMADGGFVAILAVNRKDTAVPNAMLERVPMLCWNTLTRVSKEKPWPYAPVECPNHLSYA